MRSPTLRVWIIVLSLAAGAGGAAAGDPDIDFAARRAKVLALLDSGSAMVLRSPDPAMRNGDVNYRFRQESNLLYLTGLNRPGVSLLLVHQGVVVDGTSLRVLLFARETEGAEPLPAISDGVMLPPGRFPEILNALLSRLSRLYVTPSGPGFVQDWLNGKPLFLERDSRKAAEEKYQQLKVKNASPILAVVRQSKSPAEVSLIRKAIAVTGIGITRALEICKPGVREYELQAEIEYPMYSNGGEPGFTSIIGSGPNSTLPHYDLNRRTALAGDVVVMDVGAELEGYSADITRTVPVSGKFSTAQRKVYETVLGAQRAAIASVRPGVPWKTLDATARAVIKEAGFERFWLHSISHHLGLDVHDVGSMDTLRAGMVITIEPGIYIPTADTTVAPEYRGIGVRIEDDVLVTEKGVEVLSSAIPKEVAEIERLMSRKK